MFKEEILFVRDKLNISQTELASELHVSDTTINRWETGRVQLTKKDKLKFQLFCKENKIEIEDM